MNLTKQLFVLAIFLVVDFALGKRNIKNKRPNHASCYKIKKTWWQGREETIKATFKGLSVVAWDETCSNFNSNADACTNRGGAARDAFSGILTATELSDTPCVMLGADTPLCVSNPCNNLNNGACTIQETAGLCQWNSKKQAKKFKVQYGCHRNPCHIGGKGASTDEECQARSIKGLAKCTYCKGASDPRLRGLGMGCQRVQTTTKAKCAPINENVREQSSIMKIQGKEKCQCSLENAFCTTLVDERSTSTVYEQRFPDA